MSGRKRVAGRKDLGGSCGRVGGRGGQGGKGVVSASKCQLARSFIQIFMYTLGESSFFPLVTLPPCLHGSFAKSLTFCLHLFLFFVFIFIFIIRIQGGASEWRGWIGVWGVFICFPCAAP